MTRNRSAAEGTYQLRHAVGEELRDTRIRLGLSQTAVGERMDPPLHYRTIGTIEQGTRGLLLDNLDQLCTILGTDIVTVLHQARARLTSNA